MSTKRQPAEDALDAHYLSEWHAAKYLGISTAALKGWAHRYEIPVQVIDGQPRYRRQDLNAGREKWNDAIASTNPRWVRR